jgi:hypothetical protein
MEGEDARTEEQDKDDEDQFDQEMYADDDQGRDPPKSEDEAPTPLCGTFLSLMHSC